MTKISIALATYNGERFLREQLDSFARQTRLPDELVISDDGSTDRTLAIAEEFAGTAPFPVRIERNADQLGLNGNFARAMELTSGDIILISDQDDSWYPNKIAVVGRLFAADDSIASIIHDEHVADSAGRRFPQTMLQQIHARGYGERYHVAGNCTAHRRQLLPLLLPVPARASNYDNWFAQALDTLCLRTVLDEPLQLYRRHDLNTSDPEMLRAGKARAATALNYLTADPRSGWADEIAWRRELQQRLRGQVESILKFATQDQIEQALESNERRIAALTDRSAIVSTPRRRRAGSIIRGWRNGLYGEFAGVQSLLKDLVRP